MNALIHSRIVNLLYTKHGHRDSQEQHGTGQHSNSHVTGGTASRGMTDTVGYGEAYSINPNATSSLIEDLVYQYAQYRDLDSYGGATVAQVNSTCCLDREDIFGNKYDMVDGVNLLSDSGDAGKWRIWMPDSMTHMVKDRTSGGQYMTAAVCGKYIGMIPVGSVAGSSSTYYCDKCRISTSTGRVVYCGCHGAYVNGGVSNANAGNDATDTGASVGSRLAFRGKLVRVSSVATHKAVTRAA